MKKLLIILLVVVTALIPLNVAYSQENDNLIAVLDSSIIESPISILTEFQNAFPNRSGGTDNEKLAADYLVDKLKNYGFSEYNGSYTRSFSVYETALDGTGYLTYSQNVTAKYYAKNQTDKQIIIGAHYDNAYYLTGVGAEGAYDNGSGVATALYIASQIKALDLPFNVVVAFFGMEESGVYGSRDFVSRMSEKEIDDTLMMINFDSIIGGDYLYLYSDEIPRTHEEIFFSSAEEIGFTLTEIPYDKKANGSFRINNVKPFSHIGLQSDNDSFVNAEIPTVSFTGYNLVTNENLNGKEAEGKEDIMHTSSDTLDSVIKIYGEDFVLNRLNGLTETVLRTIAKTDFTEVAEYSKAHPTVMNFFYSPYFIYGFAAFFFIVFLVAVLIIFSKLKKEKIDVSIDPETPSEEFIKSVFRDNPQEKNENGDGKDDGDDDGDVFG